MLLVSGGDIMHEPTKRTEFAVDPVLRVSICCNVTEDDGGNMFLASLAVYPYQKPQYPEK
jgi:hypothetical protein